MSSGQINQQALDASIGDKSGFIFQVRDLASNIGLIDLFERHLIACVGAMNIRRPRHRR
jgi:hypothetical protein